MKLAEHKSSGLPPLREIAGCLEIYLDRLQQIQLDPEMSDEERDAETQSVYRDIQANSEDMQTKLESMRNVELEFQRRFAAIDGEVTALQQEEQRLAGLKRTLEADRDRFLGYIKYHLQSLGERKFQCDTFAWTLDKSPLRLVIDDESKIPSHRLEPAYWIPQPPKLNKAHIKAAIKAGHEVKGCHLEQRETVRLK